MDISLIRIIDHYVGVPLCFCMTVLLRLFGIFFRTRPIDSPPERIVFIKLAEKGATVLAYPALYRAIEAVGRENVYFCVFQNNRSILDLLEVLPEENVLTIRVENALVFVKDILRVTREVRRRRISTTVDFELFARVSALLAFLFGTRQRVGLHQYCGEGMYRGNLFTHRVQHSAYLHISELYDVLVEAAFRDPAERPMAKTAVALLPCQLPKFRPSPEELAHVDDLLRDLSGVQGGPPAGLVILNPKCLDVMPIRKWPEDQFIALGRRILEAYPGWGVVISGLPVEAAACDGIVQALNSPRAISVAGRISLRELLALFTKADILVSSDSGPAHFASLTDIESVVLFGPETPALYGPLGEKAHILTAALACSPCLSALNSRWSVCHDNQCMQRITVEQVFEVVQGIIEPRQLSPHT